MVGSAMEDAQPGQSKKKKKIKYKKRGEYRVASQRKGMEAGRRVMMPVSVAIQDIHIHPKDFQCTSGVFTKKHCCDFVCS